LKQRGVGISIIFLIFLFLRGGKALNLYIRQQSRGYNSGYTTRVTPLPEPRVTQGLSGSTPTPTSSPTPAPWRMYSNGDMALRYPI
jgi:hypothetical protein